MAKTNLLFLLLLLPALSLNAQTYKNADLPDAMTFLDGSKVKTKRDWEKRKKEIKDLWCDYFIGHYPKEVPELLYAAALDKRISGVASFSGFTPMRSDMDQKPTGGIRRLWEWHHVLPKLGLYKKKQSRIPYDYEDLIKMIAPRKVLIYAPLRDRFSDAK